MTIVKCDFHKAWNRLQANNVARFRSLARLDQWSARIRNFSEPYRDWLKGWNSPPWILRNSSNRPLQNDVMVEKSRIFIFGAVTIRSAECRLSPASNVAGIFFVLILKRLHSNEIINDTSNNLLFARHTFAQAKKKKISKMIGSMSHDLYDRVIWFTCGWGYFPRNSTDRWLCKNLFTSMSKKSAFRYSTWH